MSIIVFFYKSFFVDIIFIFATPFFGAYKEGPLAKVPIAGIFFRPRKPCRNCRKSIIICANVSTKPTLL